MPYANSVVVIIVTLLITWNIVSALWYMAVLILNRLCHASHCLFWAEWDRTLLYHCKSKVFLSPLCVFYSYVHFNIINKSYYMDQTPLFASCKGTSWMTWWLSVHQYLLLWLHIDALVLLLSSSMSGANLWYPFKQHLSVYLQPVWQAFLHQNILPLTKTVYDIKFSLHSLVVEDCVQLLFCEVHILTVFFLFWTLYSGILHWRSSDIMTSLFYGNWATVSSSLF